MSVEGTGRSRRRGIVVLPTYNESLNLPILVPSILEATDLADVMVVDDGSPDGTGASPNSWRMSTRPESVSSTATQSLGVAAQSWQDSGLLWIPTTAGSARWMPTSHISLRSCQPSATPVQTPTWWWALATCREARFTAGRAGGVSGAAGSNAIIRGTSGSADEGLHQRLSPVQSSRGRTPDIGERCARPATSRLSEWAYTIHRAGLTISEVPTVFINRRLGESNMSASEAVGARPGARAHARVAPTEVELICEH